MNTTAFQRLEGQWTSEQKSALINSILRQPLRKSVMSELSVKPFNVYNFIIQRTDKPWSSCKDI